MPIVVIVLVVLVVAWFVWNRSNTLFVIAIKQGKVEVQSGQPPVQFMQVVRDVVQRPVVLSGSIKGVKTGDGVTLRASGLTEGQLQRLRNVHRLAPQSKYRAGESPVNEKTFWRAIGIAWLLEMIFRR